MKKVTTLSRWAKYRLMVSNQIITDTEHDDLNDKMEEILSSAVALEACSISLLKLAEELGNSNAEEDMIHEVESIAPVMAAFSDLMSQDLLSNMTKPKTKLRKKMPIFTMKGETV